MPFADLIFDGQAYWGKEQDGSQAAKNKNPPTQNHFKKEPSTTTATESVTFDDTSISPNSLDWKVVEETRLTQAKGEPQKRPTRTIEASVQPKVDNFSMTVPTIHRASTLGGTKQIIALDPHLISLDRLGPTSLEAKGIEIATRPSSYFHLPGSMIPKVIRVRFPMRPILKQPDSNYKPPTPFKRVRFNIVSASEENNGRNDSRRVDLLTEEDVQSLWWTKDELKQLEIREWLTARNFVRSTPRFAEAFERILIECFKNIEKDPKLSHRQLQPHGGLGLTSEEALKMMMSHDCRGLERSMVHWLSVGAAKHYFFIKKKCTVALMKAQSRWKNVDQTPQFKTEKIASAIRNYSLFAERLAQLLAEGDAAALQESENVDSMGPIERSELSRPSIPKGRLVL